jgi:hypothetical protein
MQTQTSKILHYNFISKYFKVHYYVVETNKPLFFVSSRNAPLEVFKIGLEIDVVVNLRLT